MENLRTFSNTQAVVMYVMKNNLEPTSLGIIINKPNGEYGDSAWFILTFRTKVSQDLIASLGAETALKYADRQEVRVVGKHLLPKLQPLLTGEEGAALYNKLTNYQTADKVSQEEAQAVLDAFISLIRADELCISQMIQIDEEGNQLPAKHVAHLRSSGASAEATNLSW